MKRLLFIDRDGTIIEEPADEQIDAFEKLKFVEGVIRNLVFIRQRLDFEFVIPYSRGSSQPRDQTHISFVSCIGRWTLHHCATGKPLQLPDQDPNLGPCPGAEALATEPPRKSLPLPV